MTTDTTPAHSTAAKNTDRELWCEREGDYYADSIHVTEHGSIGINVGGTVFVKPLADWHRLASQPTDRADTAGLAGELELLPRTEKAGAGFYCISPDFRDRILTALRQAPAPADGVEVRPCVDSAGNRASWDICHPSEPGASGVAVIASCYGTLEQAQTMAAALSSPAPEAVEPVGYRWRVKLDDLPHAGSWVYTDLLPDFDERPGSSVQVEPLYTRQPKDQSNG